MHHAHIAIVEAQSDIRDRFGAFLLKRGYRVAYLRPGEDVVASIVAHQFDVVIAADGPDKTGSVELIARIRGQGVEIPIVIVAKEADVSAAVEAMHAGATDVLLISESELKLQQIIAKTKKIKVNKVINKKRKLPGIDMVAASDGMCRLIDMANRIASSSATVLIQGESGTGKEVMARHLHQTSGRSESPFVAMNCAALPESLAESELFGYEKGAFTGAITGKSGKFEQARGGTLLLDEISEMPLALQAKLLRVLQEKEVDRIGGSGTVSVDVRVIATTNRYLAAMVKEGRFRKDLYYRLRIIPLVIPPLRERTEDIPKLIDHFIHKHLPADNEGVPRFDDRAMAVMINWSWPGNVRELENTIERALLLRNGDLMGPDLLLLEEDPAVAPDEATAQLVGLTVKELEERLILQTLQHVNQNRTHAAEMLGISIRTLRNKLNEYHEEAAPCETEGRS